MKTPDANAWVDAATLALRRRQPRKARAALDRAVTLAPEVGAIRLKRAQLAVFLKDAAAARTDVEAAIAAEPRPQIYGGAARVLEELGAPVEALALLDTALEAHPEALGLVQQRARTLQSLGWFRESAQAYRGALECRGANNQTRRVLAAFYTAMWNFDAAVAEYEALRDSQLDAPAAWLDLIELLTRIGRRDEAAALMAQMPQIDPDAGESLLRLARLRMAHGDAPGADGCLQRRLDDAPGDPEALALRAELHLWRGQYNDAEALAESMLAVAPARSEGHRIKGVVRLQGGDAEGALPLLDAAIARNERDEIARGWRGEALRRLERLDDAVRELDLAIIHSVTFPLVAHCNRVLCTKISRNASDTAPEVIAQLRAALPDAPGDDKALLHHALDTMAGNRSQTPTLLIDAGLVAIPVRPDSRTASRAVQEQIRTLPLAQVLPAFDALIETYGEDPTIYCHRGELHLWEGDYPAAIADFERALGVARETRWAWIGLGASQLMDGDAEAALATFAEGERVVPPPGRTMHVYRGEALLRKGELDGAEASLQRAMEINPERISAKLLMGALCERRGDADAQRRWVQEVAQAAPGLYADAVEVAGSDAAPEVTRVCFEMMRGNRSAGFVSYFLPDGRQRFMPLSPAKVVRN